MQNYYRPDWWEVWIKRNYAKKLRNSIGGENMTTSNTTGNPTPPATSAANAACFFGNIDGQ